MHLIDGARCFQAMVPMQDGVRLNTFVFLPESGKRSMSAAFSRLASPRQSSPSTPNPVPGGSRHPHPSGLNSQAHPSPSASGRSESVPYL